MSADYLSERQKSLVDSFYYQKDQELLEKMRGQLISAQIKEAITLATSITDEKVLDELVALGINVETLAALYLIPVVETAWADGAVDERERQATLDGAVERGLKKDGIAYQLLQNWLAERPGNEHLEAWKSYVAALCRSIDADAREKLKSDVMQRAKAVAQATGGILGMGNRISSSEQAVLDELERAFD